MWRSRHWPLTVAHHRARIPILKDYNDKGLASRQCREEDVGRATPDADRGSVAAARLGAIHRCRSHRIRGRAELCCNPADFAAESGCAGCLKALLEALLHFGRYSASSERQAPSRDAAAWRIRTTTRTAVTSSAHANIIAILSTGPDKRLVEDSCEMTVTAWQSIRILRARWSGTHELVCG